MLNIDEADAGLQLEQRFNVSAECWGARNVNNHKRPSFTRTHAETVPTEVPDIPEFVRTDMVDE